MRNTVIRLIYSRSVQTAKLECRRPNCTNWVTEQVAMLDALKHAKEILTIDRREQRGEPGKRRSRKKKLNRHLLRIVLDCTN